MKFTRDFNIIIAHRGPWMGLWMTINSCELALKNSGFSYSYIIVANGDREIPSDMHNALRTIGTDDKKIEQFVVHPAPMAPQNARQMGSVFGDGEYLFFFDNHCMVAPDYFTRALTKMKEHSIEMLHSTTVFHASGRFMYEYVLSLEHNFWTKGCAEHPQDKREPYRIAMGGHGGFVVKRSAWEQLDGYWTGLQGYGGEEPYFDLKFWLLGKEVWLDPKLVHYHFPGDRGYARHYTDDFYRNMMAVANIIGGNEWLMKVYDSFSRSSKSRGKTMYELLMEAEEISREHAKEMAGLRIRSLDDQLAWFTQMGIPH